MIIILRVKLLIRRMTPKRNAKIIVPIYYLFIYHPAIQARDDVWRM